MYRMKRLVTRPENQVDKSIGNGISGLIDRPPPKRAILLVEALLGLYGILYAMTPGVARSP